MSNRAYTIWQTSNVYRDLFFPKSPKYTQSLTDKMMTIINHLSNWKAVTSGMSCDINILSSECSLYPLESRIIWLDSSYKIASRSLPTTGRIPSDLWGLKTKVFMLLWNWVCALEIIQIFQDSRMQLCVWKTRSHHSITTVTLRQVLTSLIRSYESFFHLARLISKFNCLLFKMR